MEDRVAATAKYNAEFAMDLMRRAAELVGGLQGLPADRTFIIKALLTARDEMQQRETKRQKSMRTYGWRHLASDLRSYVLVNEDVSP